jgi:predicted MPP superfamily phosphohydrolase
VTVLTDRWEVLEIAGRQVALAGVAVHRNLAVGRDRAAERRALSELVRTMPNDRLTILLHHTPDLIPEAAAAGFDLYLCGHTHGGQVRLPIYGALTTFSLYGKRYEMGTYVEGGTTVFVSRGIGLEGWVLPRVRLLCPPEIVLVEVR